MKKKEAMQRPTSHTIPKAQHKNICINIKYYKWNWWKQKKKETGRWWREPENHIKQHQISFFFLLSLLLLILCSVFAATTMPGYFFFIFILYVVALSFFLCCSMWDRGETANNWKLLCEWQKDVSCEKDLVVQCVEICFLMVYVFVVFVFFNKKGIFRVNWGRIRAL